MDVYSRKSRKILQEFAQFEANRKECALCIIVHTQGSTPRKPGSKMIVFPDGSFTGTVGGGELESRVVQEAQQAIKTRKPRLIHYNMEDPQKGDPGVCGGELDVYIEPVVPESTVLIIGGGHVGQAVAHLASWLGNRVIISDDRPELCNPQIVPEADEFLPVPISEVSQMLQVTEHYYLVLTTRSVDVDVAGLPSLLNTRASYIGVIGSKRRWEQTRNLLLEKGIPGDLISKVRSPMGIDIKAETPEEIAVSIMAEIIRIQQTKIKS